MINRIRDIRKQRGMTLADLAAACSPTTTPQTIGRLETGMRNLTTGWMERIATALDVDAQMLLRSDDSEAAQIVATLTALGPEALTAPRDAILPTSLGAEGTRIVLEVETASGPYMAGDQLWLRQIAPQDAAQAINRDILVPRPGGRFAFGRLIDRQGTMVGILPTGAGQKQQIVDHPAWIAVAEMLVRPL